MGWEGVAIAGLIISAAGATYSGVSSYQQGQAQKKANKAQAEALAEQMRLQQEEAKKQAQVAEAQAGIAQIQGEQQAADRMRKLSAAIGSSYANWAGNGLLVDATGDTLSSVLTAQVSEGMADVSTIKDNAAIEVWSHLEQKRALLAQSNINTFAGMNQANALVTAGDMAARAGTNTAIGSGLTAVGSLVTGGAMVSQTFAAPATNPSLTGNGAVKTTWTPKTTSP